MKPSAALDENRILVEQAVVLLATVHAEEPLARPVQSDWFADSITRQAWSHVVRMRQGGACDLGALLGAMGPTWADLADQYPLVAEHFTLASAVHALSDYVLRDAMRRWMRELPTRADEPAAAIAWLREQADGVLESQQPAQAHTAFDLAVHHLDQVVQRRDPRLRPEPLRFGMNTLDRLVQGIYPSNVIVVGARPKVGKTQLALNWTTYWLEKGKAVLYFSLEMVEEEVTSRLIAIRGSLPSADVAHLPLQGPAWDTYQATNDWLARSRFTLYDTPLRWSDIAAQIRAHVARKEADIVVIDHLGLIVREGRKNQTTNDELGGIVRGIKNVAQELRVPIVVISQLNRAVESRDNKRPQAYDFRDTGEIEQSANLALTLWHPLPDDLRLTHGSRRPEQMPMECYIAAFRSGPAYTGVLLEWDRTTGRMADGGESPYDPSKKGGSQ